MMCELCETLDVEWVHRLDPTRSQFRVYGKGHVWSDRIRVCDRCDRMLRDGDIDALVALRLGDTNLAADVVEETIRKPLLVYRAAYLQSVAHDDVLPPGVGSLRAQGFVPVEEVTGDTAIAQAWPIEHRRSVPETRPEWLDDAPGDGRCWLIRSPWPSIPIADVFSVFWDHVDDHGAVGGRGVDRDPRRGAVAEFAALGEQDVAARIAAARDR